jgi:DNA-binding MarR family transcriptional regulator
VTLIPAGIPFTQIPNEAITDGSLSASAFRVLVYLFQRANTEARAWPSHRTIAADLDLSRTTVASALDTLRDAGWVSVHVEDEATTGHVQRHSYTVHGTRPMRLLNLPPVEANRHSKPTGTANQPAQLLVPNRPNKQAITTNKKNNQEEGAERRDLLWDAFCAEHGEPANTTERGKYNTAVALLREASVTPDEYPELVAAYVAKHAGGVQPGVMTVASRVGEIRRYLEAGPVKAGDLARRRVAALEQITPATCTHPRWSDLGDTRICLVCRTESAAHA